jgi:hypothetical protein
MSALLIQETKSDNLLSVIRSDYSKRTLPALN